MSKKRRKKKVGVISKVLILLILGLSFFFVGQIFYLNILSWFYLLLCLLVVFLFDFVCIILLIRGKKKIGFVISFILLILFGFLDFYLSKTTGLFSNLNLNYKTYHYSVVVLKESPYQKLKDLNGENLGYFEDQSDECKKSLNKVLKKIELEPSAYEDTQVLGNALLDGTVESILVEDSYLDILSESIVKDDTAFQDFVRKIYSFTIIMKTNDISKDIDVTKKPFHVYISGIDTYGEISSVSRSDVNMVVTVNPSTKQILLTSIPRDYYVPLHGKSGYRDKLTHAGLYGIDTSIQTIEDFLDIEINYYVKVNFTSVIDIVNAIGGVSVYSDFDFVSQDRYHYKKGYNLVNGEEALSFARERKAFASGDRQRVVNQQALLKAIFEKCTSKSIITKYSKLLDSVEGSFVTNMKMSRLTSLIKMQLSKNYSWNIVSNHLNGSDSSNYTYSAPTSRAYVMEPSEDSLDYAKDLIQQVLEGEKLDAEEVLADSGKANRVTQEPVIENPSSEQQSSKKEEESENKKGLEAKLNRSSFTFFAGEEFVYHGYTATYQGKDITNLSSLKEKFSINGKVFDDYLDLVSYVSALDSGEYTIIYTISYQGESVILNEEVTILESNMDFDSSDDSLNQDEQMEEEN